MLDRMLLLATLSSCCTNRCITQLFTVVNLMSRVEDLRRLQDHFDDVLVTMPPRTAARLC